MVVYQYKRHTVTAWTEVLGNELHGFATITFVTPQGATAASTYSCPLLCGSDDACINAMRAAINASIDRGVFGPSGSG